MSERDVILAGLRAARPLAPHGGASGSPRPGGSPPDPHAGPGRSLDPAYDYGVLEEKRWDPGERLARLRRGMAAVHTEFIDAGTPAGASISTGTTGTTGAGPLAGDAWARAVVAFVLAEGLPSLLYGPDTEDGRTLASVWPAGGPRLLPYDQPVETFKRELFQEEDVAAGFTTTLGGLAETGGLLLAPGPREPRLLSLVPPVHLALLRTDRIFDTLFQAFRGLGWDRLPPANALVISGPSKTADIEQTLAYGVHGPRRLVVVLAG